MNYIDRPAQPAQSSIRAADHTSHLLKVGWLIFFLALSYASWGQNCNPGGGLFPSCISSPDDCTPEDLQLCAVPGYIADENGNEITSCMAGTMITAQIFVCISNNASSAQNGIRISATLDLDGQIINVNDCFADQLGPSESRDISLGLFTFTCGACINFTDFVIGYNTNAGCQCADVTNNNGTFECPAKCEWIGDLNIPPLTPWGVNCPADVNVVCFDDTTSRADDSTAIVQGLYGDCEPLTIAFVSRTTTGDCGTSPGFRIIRTFTITDQLGRIETCVRTNFVLDEEAPTFSCPSAPSGVCDIDELAPYTNIQAFISAGGMADDNCAVDTSSFRHVGDQSNGMSCPRTFTRTYAISDLCGNETTCTQSITIDDQVSPILTCPTIPPLSCFAAVPDSYDQLSDFVNDKGSAEDNCDLNDQSFSLLSETQSGTCPTTITRIYRIEDLCMNATTCTQTITVHDQTPPTLTCPQNLLFACKADLPDPYANYAAFMAASGSASDNCGIDATTFSVDPDVVQPGTCPVVIMRTYRIQDSCGNEGSCTQTITIDDDIAPSLTCPAPSSYQCFGEVPAAYTTYAAFVAGGGSSSDNCGILESTFRLTNQELSGNCPYTLTRTYSIEDSCENEATCVQVITIDDTTAPTIVCPPNSSVQCAGSQGSPYTTLAAFLAAGGQVDDNCGIVASTFALDATASSGSCPTTITRTYGISDSCGNRATCVQTLLISDQTPPIIDCPSDLLFECLEDVPPLPADYMAFMTAGGSATDNCGVDFASYSSTQSIVGTCPTTITRTHSIRDVCGSTASCIQIITVHDQTPPTIGTCPATALMGCIDQAPTLADLPAAVATVASLGSTDNCQGSIVVSHTDEGPEIDGCSYTFTRRFFVTDECGNQDSCDQLILFTYDTTAPVLVGIEDIVDVEIGCYDNVPPVPAVSAFDDCVGDLAVNFHQSPSGIGCLNDGLIRTWSVTDPCGNTQRFTQRIIRKDLSIPVLTRGGDTTLQCGSEVPENIYAVKDDGGCTVVSHEFYEEVVDGACDCAYTLRRIWHVMDGCNEFYDTQFIYFVDTIAPEITLVNPDMVGIENGSIITSYECNVPRVYTSDIATSDCCALKEPEAYDVLVATGVCDELGYYRRWLCAYRVEDICGNVAEFKFYMDQYDTLAPVFHYDSTLVDHQLECEDALPPIPEVTIEDNCSPTPTLIFQEDTLEMSSDTFAIVRTWEASDDCGNAEIIQQTISYCGFEPDTFMASIGNMVWLDENENGIQDVGEQGINGATVHLYKDFDRDGLADPGFMRTTVTKTRDGQPGSYFFDNLNPGTYFLQFTVDLKYRFTDPHLGGDESMDSDVDPATGRSVTIVVGSGEDNIAIDAGLTIFSDLQIHLNPITNQDGKRLEVSPEQLIAPISDEAIGMPFTEQLNTRQLDVKVFPNPVVDELMLSYHGATGSRLMVEVFDALGRRIQAPYALKNPASSGQLRINFNNEGRGVYWIKIADGHSWRSIPVVKME